MQCGLSRAKCSNGDDHNDQTGQLAMDLITTFIPRHVSRVSASRASRGNTGHRGGRSGVPLAVEYTHLDHIFICMLDHLFQNLMCGQNCEIHRIRIMVVF